MKLEKTHMPGRAAIIATAFALAGIAASPSDTQAREEVQVDIMISPEGSGPYNAYAVMQTRAKEHHGWLRPIAVETPGFNYNVAFMAKSPAKWQTTVFGSGTVVEWAAKSGLEPFYREPATEVENFRIIGVMGIAGNMWVTFDDSIKTPEDFRGKNVATGLLTQNEWGMHQRMLLDGWGLTSELNNLSPLGPGQNIDALIDGRADVGTLFAPSTADMSVTITPGPFKKLQAAGREFHYVNVPWTMVEKYKSERGAPFEKRVYASGTLPGQKSELTTFGDKIVLSAHKSFPEELAYEIAKLWIDMGPVVAKYNAMGKIWDGKTIASAAIDTPEKVHPGAMRAFKELGLVE